MIIISDASPLSALADMGEIDLLRKLYGQVMIPEAVALECNHPHSPASLSTWLTQEESFFLTVPNPSSLLPETQHLGAGESSAISLAWQHRHEALLIIDDRAARKLCAALGLALTGTAGILLTAARVGLVDFDDAMLRLQATGFRISTAVIETLRQKL